ncbi:hypothetical protein EDD11_001251 [Mortierella claussenii]|nr:hypothetical protein EDD11_001251 [Mortierella claussenii]
MVSTLGTSGTRTSGFNSLPKRTSSPPHIAAVEEQGHEQVKTTTPLLRHGAPRLPSLNVGPHYPHLHHTHTHHGELADTLSFLRTSTSSSSSPSASSSSSSSSLSDYLIIGQEPVERDDSESDDHDRHSEQSFASGESFYEGGIGEGEGGRYPSDASVDGNQSDDYHYHHQQQQQPYYQHSDIQSQPRQAARSRPHSQPRRQYHRASYPTHVQDENDEDGEANEQDTYALFMLEQEQYLGEFASSSSRPSSPHHTGTNNNYKARKQKSHRSFTSHSSPSAQEEEDDDATVGASAQSTIPVLPAIKIPSIRGLARSMTELAIASVVCLTLLSLMFALSYLSTGANHLLGWYSDQRIGQRIRDGIKEREHFVQEALEKMAGEEYVKIKRRSRQYQQQQQQQPHSSYNGNANGHPYQNRYQQQYQQQREERQQQQRQQQQQSLKEGLSTAEWQDLIRAASVSFMAKFTAPKGRTRGPGRR